MRRSSSEESRIEESAGGSSSETSAIVKSERVAILMDGEWATGVTEGSNIVVGSGTEADSSGGGGEISGSGSLLGSPRDVAMGVAAGSLWFAPVGLGFPVLNTGGGGRPSQPHSRNATTS